MRHHSTQHSPRIVYDPVSHHTHTTTSLSCRAIVVVGLIFVTVLGRRDGDSSSASTKNNVDEENNESPFEPLLEQHKIMGILDCDEGDGGDDGDDS